MQLQILCKPVPQYGHMKVLKLILLYNHLKYLITFDLHMCLIDLFFQNV